MMAICQSERNGTKLIWRTVLLALPLLTKVRGHGAPDRQGFKAIELTLDQIIFICTSSRNN